MLIDREKLRIEPYSKTIQYLSLSGSDKGGLICDKMPKLYLVAIGNLCYCFIGEQEFTKRHLPVGGLLDF